MKKKLNNLMGGKRAKNMLRILAKEEMQTAIHIQKGTQPYQLVGGTQIKTAMKCQFSSIRLANKLKDSRVRQSIIEGTYIPSMKVCQWPIHREVQSDKIY